MPYFLILLSFVFLTTTLVDQRKSVDERLVTSLVYCIGFVIFVGNVLGISSLRGTDLLIQVFALVFLTYCVKNQFRSKNLSQSRSTNFQKEQLLILATPGLFLCLVGLLFLKSSTNNMNYLMNTWDGASNAGMVGALRHFEQISVFPKTLGVETYPTGGHYVASWLADLVTFSGYGEARSTVHAFASMTLVTYSALLLTIGIIVVRLGRIIGIQKWIYLPAAIVSQSFLIAPFLTENLLLMHSLGFMLALFVTNSVIIHLLSSVIDGKSQFHVDSVFYTSLGSLIVCFSYPTFLPIFVILFLYLILRKDFWGALTSQSRRLHNWLMVAGASLLLALVIIQVSAVSSFSSPTSRFSLQGHIVPVPGKVVLGLGFCAIALALCSFKTSRSFGALLTLFVSVNFQMVLSSWQLSESWSRDYGLNYYAKKSEYVFVVLLLPISLLGLCRISLIIFQKWRKFATLALTPVVIAFTYLSLMGGTYSLIVKRSENFVERSELMKLALSEADIPGRALIWTESNPELSRYASLMTNYLDPTAWIEPDIESRTMILAQQLSVRSPDKPWQDFCGFIDSPKYGSGRITVIGTGLLDLC